MKANEEENFELFMTEKHSDRFSIPNDSLRRSGKRFKTGKKAKASGQILTSLSHLDSCLIYY
jgi:hypothetical protein